MGHPVRLPSRLITSFRMVILILVPQRYVLYLPNVPGQKPRLWYLNYATLQLVVQHRQHFIDIQPTLIIVSHGDPLPLQVPLSHLRVPRTLTVLR